MDAREAIATLEATFARRGALSGGSPAVGVFGNGVPLAPITAAGFAAVDVKSPPDGRIGASCDAIIPYLEPFLDDYARVFLNRLFAGDFDDLAAIVFPRDDAAALTACQYASEFLRQGIAPARPRLILWNLVHSAGPAIDAFNRHQAAALCASLADLAGAQPGTGIAQAQAAERARAEALAELDAMTGATHPLIAGAEAFRWRNAGRYLDPNSHAALLRAALESAARRPRPRSGRRIGLIGTALDDPGVYDAIESAGTIVCDLQPFGSNWPGPSGRSLAEDAGGLAAAEARDALSTRARPELEPIETVLTRLAAARCDLVVAQYDEHDDTFGWELPGIRRRLAERGIPLLDLGFRALRPDDAWLDAVRSRLISVAETQRG